MHDRFSVASARPGRPGRRPRALMLGGALGLALLVAACTGPTVHREPPTAGNYAVTVDTDPSSLQRGQKATINYSFVDTRTGKAATNLPLVHDSVVHTTLVNHDFTWFRTGMAVAPIAGKYPVNLRFGDPDSYRLYAEFTAGYTPTQQLLYPHTITFGLNVPSLEQAAQLIESPTPRENSFFGVTVNLDTGSGSLKAGQPAMFHYRLTIGQQGEPVRDVAPLNGAGGNLYVISADGEQFAHLYSQEVGLNAPNAQNEPTAGGSTGSQGGNPAAPGPGNGVVGAETPTAATGGATGTPTAAGTGTPGPQLAGIGPDLTFNYTFAKPGMYKTWLEFLYHGQPVTADYVVSVTP